MALTMMTKTRNIILGLLLLVPLACQRGEVPEGDLIRVGGVEADVEVETKADAETVDWLVPLLREGMDITYGLDKDRTTAREVRLTLRKEDVLDKYSFLYRDSGLPGRWMGNGAHFFEGVYIPQALTEGTDLLQDQRDYTQLSHYLSLPPAFTLNATVARIKLPLRHRLARVLAYILIDPTLGSDVTLEGYTTPDDPLTTKIRFCNVNVLSGVADGKPQWAKARKVVPHFVEEKQDFVIFYDTQKKAYYYPTDPQWDALNASLPAGYERYEYGTVPVYDVIVRPTYTSDKTVMYDEDPKAGASATNKIDFEVTLSNGLQYTREFVFDLDANHETIVYLRIGRKSVDYNSSGSELWVETVSHDDYYGTDNPGGHNLSHAGGSWQRAYRIGTLEVGETDGEDYDGTGTYAWITENCAKYGFILRYPEGLVSKTGIQYEPWHYRYVGSPHASIIMNNDLCLEDYIELVKSYPYDGEHMRVIDYDGKIYEIYYYGEDTANDSTMVPVPNGMDYTVFGNNLDGFIITVDTGETDDGSASEEEPDPVEELTEAEEPTEAEELTEAEEE